MIGQNSRPQGQLRNFSIIAHIDHGKTTLTDQLLRQTHTLAEKDMIDRLLDSNPIERERGITIKLAPVTMEYSFNNSAYQLNLIDTPGHVDFSYEVSRSLTACEGAILLVDATQGIQAQTLAHARRAQELNLKLLPALNKIDLHSARIDDSLLELEKIFGIPGETVIRLSAKTGEGVENLLAKIVTEIPSPQGDSEQALRALIFNSIYDSHLGVIAFVRIVDGSVENRQHLFSVAGQTEIEIKELGIFTPTRRPLKKLTAGQVGYIATGLKDIRSLQVGDTLTLQGLRQTQIQALPGFKLPQPVVFADLYPAGQTNFSELQRAVEKLRLTDAALDVKPIHSSVLGGGFCLGFLGLFHAEITRERLKREHDIDTILTKPTVEYLVKTRVGDSLRVQNPSQLPDPENIISVLEPVVEAMIFTPLSFIGSVMQLFQDKRGVYQDTLYLNQQARLVYHLPLSELISGFVDELKSVSQGFASLDYRHIEPRPVEIVKLKIVLNHVEMETLSRIVVKQNAESVGRELVTKLKDILPRQMFALPIQAAIGGQIIARETKPAARKDVTAKLYGGDRTRRMKLLEKQKKGKKIMAGLGRVSIPPETYLHLMKV